MQGYYVKDGKMYLDTHGHAFPVDVEEVDHIMLQDCLKRPVYEEGLGLHPKITATVVDYLLKHFTIRLKEHS